MLNTPQHPSARARLRRTLATALGASTLLLTAGCQGFQSSRAHFERRSVLLQPSSPERVALLTAQGVLGNEPITTTASVDTREP